MRKTFLIILVLFYLNNLFAETKEVEGIITLNDTSIKVVLLIPFLPFSDSIIIDNIDFASIQKNITYHDSTGIEHILTPEKTKKVTFYLNNKEVILVGLYNNFRNLFEPKYIFLKLDISGNLKKYRYIYYETDRNGVKNIKRTVDVLQVENGDVFVPAFLNDFAFYMKKYLKNCSNLTDKIDTKVYTSKNIDEIVQEYNNCNIK